MGVQMNHKNKLLIGVLMVGFLLLTACHGSKKIVSTPSVTKTIKVDSSARVQYIYHPVQNLPQWIYAEMDVEIQSDKFSQDVSAKVKIKRNDTAWISITGFLGIEGARILVTKDSFELLDRLNRKYYKEHVSLATKLLPFDISLSKLQYMILGWNAEQIDTAYHRSNKADTILYQLNNDKKQMMFCFWNKEMVNCSERYIPNQLSIAHLYSDFRMVDQLTLKVAMERDYNIYKNSDKSTAKVHITELKINQVQSFNFSVSSGYERVRL